MRLWLKASVLVASAPLLTPPLAHALSQDVADVFSRGRRVLPPPPKALRADSPSSDTRLAAGSKRRESDPDATYKDLKVSTKPYDKKPDDETRELEKAAKSDENDEGATPEGARPRRRHKPAAQFNGSRVFGVGLVGGGAYGVFGMEFDFGIADRWTVGFGLGTGMTYSTWGAHGRFFLAEGTFSPFVEVGYANWYLREVSKTGKRIIPSFLAERFFEDKNGNAVEGTRLHLLYPGIGILYQTASGIAASFQAQYFINVSGFSGGLFGALGFYYYF